MGSTEAGVGCELVTPELVSTTPIICISFLCTNLCFVKPKLDVQTNANYSPSFHLLHFSSLTKSGHTPEHMQGGEVCYLQT